MLQTKRNTVLNAISSNPARLAHAGTLPAWQRYNGVVWKHLGPESLSTLALERAVSSVAVVSALGGLFAWDDPVPEYKLKMSATLPETGRLATLWEPELSGIARESDLVIDLLPLEHRSAFQLGTRSNWVRIELTGPNGERAGHNGKAAKGRLARALLESGSLDVTLSQWEEEWDLRVT